MRHKLSLNLTVRVSSNGCFRVTFLASQKSARDMRIEWTKVEVETLASGG